MTTYRVPPPDSALPTHESRPITDTADQEPPFYVTGGSLPEDAPSYVERQADSDLVEALRAGQFCYVLDSRQVGKSSLMVRAAAQLRRDGVRVAVLDLSGAGQNVTAEQWYFGLLFAIADQLCLETSLEAFWEQHTNLGLVQRWMAAIRQVVLDGNSDPLVLFVDEIDAVRSLPFSVDEFFAAIRECHNRRTRDPILERLAVCLLGVATPSDLIRNPHTTPFNVGRRIVLEDFRAGEALPLARGLARERRTGMVLLRRVLYWTGGHPYLTQRLCQEIQQSHAQTARAVDRQCVALFLTHTARSADTNLVFVRDWLVRAEADRAALLDLYAKVRTGRRVPDDETNPLASLLKLSGVVRVHNARLRVRNRIYARVFDPRWVTRYMPDAELRRQREAYLRGMRRVVTVSSAIFLIMGSLLAAAILNYRRANANGVALTGALQTARKERTAALTSKAQAEVKTAEANAAAVRTRAARKAADGARKLADARAADAARSAGQAKRAAQSESRERRRADARALGEQQQRARAERLLYPSLIVRAQQALGQTNLAQARKYLAEFAHPRTPQEDLRGFEWRYLARECRDSSRRTLTGHRDGVKSVAYSPDGAYIASVGGAHAEYAVRVWNATTGQPLRAIEGLNPERGLVFLKDGHTLVVGCKGDTVLCDVRTGRVVTRLPARDAKGLGFAIYSLALSADGTWLACGLHSGRIDMWNIAHIWNKADLRPDLSLLQHPDGDNRENFTPIYALAFSQDGRSLASGCEDGAGPAATLLWDRNTSRAIALPLPQQNHRGKGHIYSLAFSLNDGYLVAGGENQGVWAWDVAKRAPVELGEHAGDVTGVTFSPDGTRLATCSDDGTLKVWDARGLAQGKGLREAATLYGHSKGVKAVAFSPDGTTLLSGSLDSTLKEWQLKAVERPRLQVHEGRVAVLAYARDGHLLTTAACGGDNLVRVWDARTRQRVAQLPPSKHDKADAAYATLAPDGKTVAVASLDRTLTLYDARNGRMIAACAGVHEGLNVAAFSPDGRLLAAGERETWNGPPNNGYMVRLWDMETHTEIKAFAAGEQPAHLGWIIAMAFSPDGKTLVTGGGMGELRWWDVVQHKEIGPPPQRVKGDTVAGQFVHEKDIRALAFSPDGRWLASASEDGTVRLWDMSTRRPVHLLLGHTGIVYSLAFSHDGRTLATGHAGGSIKLWSLTTLGEKLLQETATLQEDRSDVTSLAFAPDDSTLAAGSRSGAVVFWQATNRFYQSMGWGK